MILSGTSTLASRARAAAMSSLGGGGERHVAVAEVGEIDPEPEPLQKRHRRRFLVALAFIERNHAEPRGMRDGSRLALHMHGARVHDKPEPRSKSRLHALAGRHDQITAVHVGEQAALCDGLAVRQRCREVETAEQTLVGGVERELTEGNVVRQDAAQEFDPLIAHRPIFRADDNAAEADRVYGEQRGRHDGLLPERPFRRRFPAAVQHHPNVFCKASSTRTVEPASSRGSRRRRWRSEGGATCLRCAVLTVSEPS